VLPYNKGAHYTVRATELAQVQDYDGFVMSRTPVGMSGTDFIGGPALNILFFLVSASHFILVLFLGSAISIISAFLMVNLVYWGTGAGLGLGFPGLQLGFGAGAGCGVGVGFGYGLGKGRAYDYDHTYSNVGRLPRRSNSVTGSSG
jgi:hypothetical protein